MGNVKPRFWNQLFLSDSMKVHVHCMTGGTNQIEYELTSKAPLVASSTRRHS